MFDLKLHTQLTSGGYFEKLGELDSIFFIIKSDKGLTEGIITCAALTFSVPRGHGDEPVDPHCSHGADHSLHGQGVARHRREDGGLEAEAGHDHILSFEMSLQIVL